MTSSLYPSTTNFEDNDQTIQEIVNNLQQIARLREQEDISDFNNLDNRFVKGRGLFQARATPSSPTDVLAADEEGDIVSDASFEYKLLNISGTLKWDRRALDVAW